MSDTVIKVENLSKSYQIRHQTGERYTALRDVLSNGIKGMGNRLLGRTALASSATDASREEFWALNDVSFEVKQGERVGIIGRNGAGKSTLLKILSRITEPTKGRVHIKGRVASLLEVGTGFHPELTGRENIYLNGAILGMSRAEIKHKFDEIVAFAEVEKFLDTPVKRYSSGMYVRLAFAVAAHLESEILVIDEVLAVGDAAFHKKSLQKMESVSNSGQTILFVSHNLGIIQSLCNRAVLLVEGNLIADKSSSEAVKLYMSESKGQNSFIRNKQGSGRPTIVSGSILPQKDSYDSAVYFHISIYTEQRTNVAIDLRLKDFLGQPIGLGSFGAMRPIDMIQLKPGYSDIHFSLATNLLATGAYLVSMDLTIPGVEYYDRSENCLSFDLLRQPVVEGTINVLPQAWGYGCVELALQDLKIEQGTYF